jgi:Phage tail lysozyme
MTPAYNQQAIALIWSELASRGVKPAVAAGVIAGIMGESGAGIDPTAFNAKDEHGGSGGILQWNDTRLVGPNGLLAFARAHGIDVNPNVPTDSKKVPLAIQVKFMGHELDGRYSGVLKGLQVLNTGEEGLNTWVDNMEVPRDPAGAKAQRRQYVEPVSKLLGAPTPVTPLSTAAAPGGGSPAQAPPEPPSAMAQIGSTLGSAISGMVGDGGAMSAPTQGPLLDASMDAPAIRTPALGEDFTPPPANPVPANIAAGAGSTPLATQLGMLAAAPVDPMLANPAVAPSITAGAPSMTSLLGGVGGAQVGNIYDPRRPSAVQPGLAYPRIG